MNRRHALGMLGAAALTVPPLTASAADPLHLATIPLESGAEIYYALDKGFFKSEGIDATIDPISSGPAIAAAVASGAVDIGFSNLISIAAAYKRGVPFTLVAPGSLYTASIPTSVLMVPANSPVKSAKDLNGKTFGVNGLKSIVQYAPQLWIDKNGGDSTSIHFIEMTFPDILQSLANNRIDAAIVAEPFITEAKANGARILADAYDAIGSIYIIGCWFTTTSWAKAHAPLAERFARVIEKTANWANKNKTESGGILTAHGKLDEKTVRTMLRLDYAPRFDVAQMQPVIDLAARYGGLPATFPASELIFKP